ncbi:MAG: hypothetical protein HPY79_02050 [Bacteroidales bacterium]|nr:hypothetical protein [Bacteroidales bacterium]
MSDFKVTSLEKSIFNFVSIIFHPIFIPTILIYLTFSLFSSYFIFNPNYVLALTTLFFLLTVIIPLVVLILFYYFKFIQSFYLQSKEERILVSLTMNIFYVFATYSIRNIYIHPNIYLAFLTVPIVSTLFSVTIFLYPKVSMHTFGLGSLIGVLLFYRYKYILISNFEIVIFLFMVSGLIMTARLILKAHDYRDVIWGFIIGICESFFSILCVYYIF